MERQKSKYDPLQGNKEKATDDSKRRLDIPKKSTIRKSYQPCSTKIVGLGYHSRHH